MSLFVIAWAQLIQFSSAAVSALGVFPPRVPAGQELMLNLRGGCLPCVCRLCQYAGIPESPSPVFLPAWLLSLRIPEDEYQALMAERRRRGLPHISRTAATRNRSRGHQHERAEAKAKATAARAVSRTPPPPPAPRRFQQPIRLVEGPGARTMPEQAQGGGSEAASSAHAAKQEPESRGSASMEDASSGMAPKQEMAAQSRASSEAASSSKAPKPNLARQSNASGEVASPGKEPKLEARVSTGSGDAPSGARAVSDDKAEEDSDTEVSSAASLEMEPLREQTLADLMEHWVQAKRVKTEEPGPEPHMACLKQANQRHPKSARHWLSAEAFLFADVISGFSILPGGLRCWEKETAALSTPTTTGLF